MNSQQRTARESSLTDAIQRTLPSFFELCSQDVEEVLLHQDAFAADYQDEEYRLLGMAIKYAGLQHKTVRVVARM
jgi:hypothetical protein